MNNAKGLIYVFEGDGKGKTSAALGVVVRMLLLGKKVVWISWFKEKSWNVAEMKLPKLFKETLKMYWMGKGFYGSPGDHDTPEGHRRAAVKAILHAKKILQKNEGGGGMGVDLLVLDESVTAILRGLIKVEDIEEIVKMRGKTHIVLTGHGLPVEIEKMADLITEMKKIKHPFDKGVLAVSGLDF